MANILVTGASGFIGRHLVDHLRSGNHQIIEAGRRQYTPDISFRPVNSIDAATDWSHALSNIDAVIHLAAIAHHKATPQQIYQVNDAGTAKLIQDCLKHNIRGMILMSSIAARQADKEHSTSSDYAKSKWAAEQHLVSASTSTGFTGIALRPPLVYGPDAPGNWNRLQKLAATSLPLPFGSVTNRRSLCSIGNLCHAIETALEYALTGQGQGVYEIADLETVSLSEIITLLRQGVGQAPHLLPFPPQLLRFGLGLIGKKSVATALLDDLTIDISDFSKKFEWQPPQTAHDTIRKSI